MAGLIMQMLGYAGYINRAEKAKLARAEKQIMLDWRDKSSRAGTQAEQKKGMLRVGLRLTIRNGKRYKR